LLYQVTCRRPSRTASLPAVIVWCAWPAPCLHARVEVDDELRTRERGAGAREGLRESWPTLSLEERVSAFRSLAGEAAQELFVELSSRDQAELLGALSPRERRLWIRLLPPDDVADLLLEIPPEERSDHLALLDEATRGEVSALLAYAEDAAGGLMS